MYKIFFLLPLLFSLLQAEDPLLTFYKSTLNNLHYTRSLELYKDATKLKQEALHVSHFANFSLDGGYAQTKAQHLSDSFYTSGVSLSDSIDIFGKNSYKMDEIALEFQSKQTLLKIQKEQLFATLVSMIATYWQTSQQLSLHVSMIQEQQHIYEMLQKLQLSGAVPKINLIRFANSLTTSSFAPKSEQFLSCAS